MPLDIPASAPTVLIRRAAFERAGLARSLIDARFNHTADEFRVEGDLLAIGPLPGPGLVADLVQLLEEAGLVYFDDVFELPGGWPDWVRLLAMSGRR